MPSTTTTSFGQTALGVVKTALRGMRVIIEGATPSTQQLTDGIEQLNMILKSLATSPQGMKLWCYSFLPVPLVAGQLTYTIGPSGANVTSWRPLRVMEYGNYYQQIINGSTYDTPVRLISRTEYSMFGSKSSTGQPNSIYYLPGIDTATGATAPTGYGTLYVYNPLATTATGTLYLNTQRAIYDITAADGSDSVDLPSEWFLFLKWKLMAEWGDEFEVPEDRLMRYAKMAQMAGESCGDWSTEEAAVTFGMDRTGY